jgi:hypothetical protein
MKVIRDVIGRAEALAAQADVEAKRIESSRMTSAEYQKQQKAELKQATAESVIDALRALWGDESDKTKPLEGGRVWAVLENAQSALVEARTGTDPLDQLRLRNERDRVPGAVQHLRNVVELGEWYEKADAYTRRALQDRPDVLASRFKGDDSIGGFLGQLRNDRAESLRTPELAQAEKRMSEAIDVAADTWERSKRLAELLGLSGYGGAASAILGRVEVTWRFEDVSKLDSKAVWTFTKKAPPVVIKGA